jgi:hypothetical protein
MVSKKMKAMLGNNSVIRKMFEEGNRLAKIYGRENVFDFSLGNPNMPAPAAINKAIVDVLSEEDPVLVHGYMTNAGYLDVREKLAKSLNKKYNTDYKATNLIMTSGAAMAINILLKAIIDKDDEVITFAPYFVEYGNYVSNYDGKLVVIPADTKTFMPDLEKLKETINAKTKAIIINTPHNPTGVVYSEEVLKGIDEVITQKEKELGTTILTISDEPYRELVYDNTYVPWVPTFIKHAVVVYSYSKSFSLAGERIGWLLVPSNIPESEDIVSAATIANRCCGSVNAPSLIQRAISRCFDMDVNVEFYAKNRNLIYNGLKELKFDVVKPQGAFYLFVKAPNNDDKSFCEICKKYNILLVPGSAFACAGYARLSYCVSEDMIKRSLLAFEKVAKEVFN